MSGETEYVVHLRVTVAGRDAEWEYVATSVRRALNGARVGRGLYVDTVEVDQAPEPEGEVDE